MAIYHHGDLREALLTAATEMLGEVEDITLRSLARRVGVTPMAPYRHFIDKKDLLRAVAMRGLEALRTRMIEADAAPEPRQALIAQGIAYIRFAREHPELFRLMFASLQWPTAAGASTYGVLAARVAQLAPEERRREATLACWGITHGIALLILDRQLLDPPEDDGRGSLELLVAGLIG